MSYSERIKAIRNRLQAELDQATVKRIENVFANIAEPETIASRYEDAIAIGLSVTDAVNYANLIN